MKVRIYDYDDAGNEILRGTSELLDCFPDGRSDPEYNAALTELVHGPGRYWIGGGAAPFVLLMLAED